MQSLTKQSEKYGALARGAYLLAVLIGTYALVWTLTGFAAGILVRLGLERSEVAIASTLLGLLLYPALVILALTALRPLLCAGLITAASMLLAMLRRTWGAS